MIPAMAYARNREERRQMIMQLERDNKAWPAVLTDVPKPWPAPPTANWHSPVRVMRSREFMLQVFEEAGGIVRLSFNRTHVDPQTLRWVDGITWDELQQLKAEAGYGDRQAVEIYPSDADVVNVGSLRHLWLLPEPLPFTWRDGHPR